MKKSIVIFSFILLIITPSIAQENFDTKYSNEKIQKISPIGVEIINVEIQDKYIIVNFISNNQQNVAELMKQISKYSLGNPTIKSLRKKTNDSNISYIEGIIHIK